MGVDDIEDDSDDRSVAELRVKSVKSMSVASGALLLLEMIGELLEMIEELLEMIGELLEGRDELELEASYPDAVLSLDSHLPHLSHLSRLPLEVSSVDFS